MAETTVEKRCNCKSDYQDALYGSGIRLMNLTFKKAVRCTVCGTTHSYGEDSKKNNASPKGAKPQ